jgi:hypothetical protein
MNGQRGANRLLRLTRIALIAMLLWLLLAPLHPVAAHGDGRVLQLATVAGDAFHLTVWSAPSILRTGEIHIVTAVTGVLTPGAQGTPPAASDAASDVDVLVQVQLVPLTGIGERKTALAYPLADTSADTSSRTKVDSSNADPSNRRQAILHEAAFFVAQPGRYQVQVTAVDITGASGSVGFPIQVVKVPGWVTALIYVQFAISGLAALLLLRQGQRLWLGHRSKPTTEKSVAAN